MLNAYRRAAKGKHDNKEVILYEMDLASYLMEILRDLQKGSYRPGVYRKFIIYEPKRREIRALPFKDRVVHQWYVEEFIKPIFLPKFIVDTYACIQKRGLHAAIEKLRDYMKKKYKENEAFYILKCDISKFFYSIQKDILINIISRYVKDADFLELTKKIIYDGTGKVGIPIGNYTSQFFANIYLNELDHFVKEKLGVKYYIRYMDDFVLLLDSKEQCKEIKQKMGEFLTNKLKLQFNHKTNYFKNRQGVTFCGYRIFIHKILLKTDSKKKIYKKVKTWNKLYNKKELDLENAYVRLRSWVAHAEHADSEKLIKNVKKKCLWLTD